MTCRHSTPVLPFILLITKKTLHMKICLLCICLVLYFSLCAQTLPSSGLHREAFMGRVIQVIPAATKGYGYEIFFMGRLAAIQNVNPFTMAPAGLRSQEDALAVARWHIRQTLGTPARGLARNKRFPLKVAEELSIKLR
jgi:hypothetical protein